MKERYRKGENCKQKPIMDWSTRETAAGDGQPNKNTASDSPFAPIISLHKRAEVVCCVNP